MGDTSVDREFGTGVVKITPAHDFNDYQVGVRHGLALLSIFTLDAKVNENAPPAYRGMDRFAARKKVVADLEAAGLVDAIKPHTLMQPRSQRSDAVVEPMLSDQWFVRMDGLAKAGLEAVAKGDTVLACAPSNHAVDNLLEKLLAAGELPVRDGTPIDPERAQLDLPHRALAVRRIGEPVLAAH